MKKKFIIFLIIVSIFTLVSCSNETNKSESSIDKTVEDNSVSADKEVSQKEENKEEKNCPCCSGKHKERQEKEKKDLMNRLKRIEGQVRGIENMLEKDAYCTDILVQVAAVNAALNSFNKVLLANHIKTCVTKDIKEGREETVDELVTVLQKLMK